MEKRVARQSQDKHAPKGNTDTKDSSHVMFWRPDYQYGSFSQWYPSQFVSEPGSKQVWACAEQFMMVQKAKLFGDEKSATLVMATTDPAKMRMIGRGIKPFVQKTWDEKCDEIVYNANLLKFTQNENMKILLLSTGNRTIVEASPYDRIWGIGFDQNDAMANVRRWGENKLGKALMRVRETLLQSLSTSKSTSTSTSTSLK